MIEHNAYEDYPTYTVMCSSCHGTGEYYWGRFPRRKVFGFYWWMAGNE